MNKLSLRNGKTNYMIFSNKEIDKPDVLVKIDQKVIRHVTVTKLLGIMQDCHLQWKEHVTCVNLKISKCIAILHNLRDS